MEAGVRIRGVFTPRLSWGATGSISESKLAQVTSVQAKAVAAGIGYLLTPRTLVTVDATGGGLPPAVQGGRSRRCTLLFSGTSPDVCSALNTSSFATSY